MSVHGRKKPCRPLYRHRYVHCFYCTTGCRQSKYCHAPLRPQDILSCYIWSLTREIPLTPSKYRRQTYTIYITNTPVVNYLEPNGQGVTVLFLDERVCSEASNVLSIQTHRGVSFQNRQKKYVTQAGHGSLESSSSSSTFWFSTLFQPYIKPLY